MEKLFLLLFLICSSNAVIFNTTSSIPAQSSITFPLFSNGTLSYIVEDQTKSLISVYVTEREWIESDGTVTMFFARYSAIKVFKANITDQDYDMDSNLVVVAIYNNNLIMDTTVTVFINNTVTLFNGSPSPLLTSGGLSRMELIIILCTIVLSGVVLVAFVIWYAKRRNYVFAEPGVQNETTPIILHT